MQLWIVATRVMEAWQAGKLFIEDRVALSHDSLHLIVGTLVWLAFALLLRRSVVSLSPWLWAFAVILWNETVDLWTEQWPNPWMQYEQAIKDLVLTMATPTMLLLAARVRPQLLQARSTRRRV